MSRAPSLDVRWVLRAALIVSLLLALGTYVIRWLADPPLPYLLRTESRPGYLERHLGEHYRALDFINSRLPADSRVLFLWEPRSYLCTAACVADPLLLTWRHLLHLHGTGEAAVAAVRQSGYTHLLVNGGGLRFFAGGARPEVGPEHVQALQAAEATLLDRLYGPSLDEVLDVPLEAIAGSGYIVFRVRERP